MCSSLQLWFALYSVIACVADFTSDSLPEIWYSSFSPEYRSFEYDLEADPNFRNSSIYKNEIVERNGSEYVVSSTAAYVYFTCQAAYPIRWNVPDKKQLKSHPFTDYASLRTYSRRLSKFSSSWDSPSNGTFQQFLRVDFKDVQYFTVSFTCQEIRPVGKSQQALLNSSIHIYYSLGDQVLDGQDETISLVISPNASSAVVPCRPATPYTKVIIEKHNGTEWEQLQNAEFNPRIGFTLLNFSGNGSYSLPGMYRCIVHGNMLDPNEDQFVNFRLIRDKNHKSTQELSTKSNLVGDVKVEVVGTYKNQIRCCSTKSSKTPRFQIVEHCEDYFSCDIFQSIIYPRMKAQKQFSNAAITTKNNCVETTFQRSPVFVECVGADSKSLSTGLYLATFFDGRWDETLMIHKEVDSLGNLTLDNTMIIAVGKDIFMNDQVLEKMRNVRGFVHKVYENRYSFDEKEHKWGRYLEHMFDEYPRKYYYNGEKLWFMCMGPRYFYSDGGFLRLNWNNGSKTVLPHDNLNRYRWVHLLGPYVERKSPKNRDYHGFQEKPPEFSTVFAETMTAKKEMHSVDCFLPRWNSSNWDKLHFKVWVF